MHTRTDQTDQQTDRQTDRHTHILTQTCIQTKDTSCRKILIVETTIEQIMTTVLNENKI